MIFSLSRDRLTVHSGNVTGTVSNLVPKGGLSITIKDIAREAGCSVSTVSRVLSGHPDVSPATRERVQELIRLHRFSPNNNAQRLKQQESRTVGIVVKGTSNALFASLIEVLQTRIE